MGLRPSMAQKSNMWLNPAKGLLLVQHLSIVSLSGSWDYLSNLRKIAPLFHNNFKSQGYVAKWPVGETKNIRSNHTKC